MGLDAARLHDELLSQMPEGARHDSDICTFCADKAARTQAQASVPSGSEPSDAPASELLPNPEGGTTQEMAEKENETLSRETHEALLAKAVGDASAATEAALARKIEENTELAGQVSTLTAQNAELSADNDRLNKELDTAQVALKVATDEVAALKADNAAKDEAARRAEIAGKRADQVANLGLFPKEYVQEKAARWAEFSDEDWAERIDEWTKAKPGDAGSGAASDSASALSGTSEKLTDETKTTKSTARRAVLGLS